MKFLLLFLLLHGNFSLASMEHKTGMGSAPDKNKLGRAHACFKEIKTLGCGHPREDQIFFTACLDDKRDSLSSACQKFFIRLYGKRN